MQPVKRLVFLTAVFAVLVDVGTAAVPGRVGSFIRGCNWDRCKLKDNRILGTYCNNENYRVFDYDWTQCVESLAIRWNTSPGKIDLGKCVANIGGSLNVREEYSLDHKELDFGEYWKSCDSCYLTNRREYRTQYLVCDCLTLTETRQQTWVDVGRVLYNYNGTLSCFAHRGPKFDRPPPEWSEIAYEYEVEVVEDDADDDRDDEPEDDNDDWSDEEEDEEDDTGDEKDD
ncbi:hypothetical protein ACRALDRAFT_2047454 [Sodiomyces alcalophilus JCM 7366]|uniref:uncharacterized protein n=1 Tax=Sodiomyces alcalophilus JCM 7366 TaxID=591952 RepID=UPI0039B44425